MNFMVPLALLGWPVVVLLLFATLRPRRAVVVGVIAGWLFLPMAGYNLPGLTSYDKTNAITLSVTLGVLIFDAGRFLMLRPCGLDLAILIWCVSAAFTSLVNDLGLNDAGSNFIVQLTHWGLPYLLGRLYFSDVEGLKELAVGVFVGGLVYAPFCLWEIRMSPRLHTQLYGFHQHEFSQTKRGDGYRPMVFMQHGLMLSMWMAMATLTGVWLTWSKTLRRLWGQPTWLLAGGLAVTTVLCKSTGALGLLLVGGAVLVAFRWFQLRIAVILLALVPVIYIAVRAPGFYDGSHLLDTAELMVSSERVGSLRYRLEAEDILSEHARKQPWFGWGSWNRNRPAEMGVDGARDVATDGFWIITFGKQGLLGLVAAYAMMLVPAVVLAFRWRAIDWVHPVTAPVGCLAVILLLYAIDNLVNAMISPVYTVVSGGLIGFVASGRRLSRISLMAAKQQVATNAGSTRVLTRCVRGN